MSSVFEKFRANQTKERLVLSGDWSQSRLYHEASLYDVKKSSLWCERVGLTELTDWQTPSIPLNKALMIVHCFANTQPFNQAQLACRFKNADELIHKSIIKEWYDYLRDCLIDYVLDPCASNDRIGGPGKRVQFDLTKVGTRKAVGARIAKDTTIISLIDTDAVVCVASSKSDDKYKLTDVIKRTVEPGSNVHSDKWPNFDKLPDEPNRRGFRPGNLKKEQSTEEHWKNIKSVLKGGGASPDTMAAYIMEYAWRYQCKKRSRDPFVKLVELLVKRQAGIKN